MCQYNASECKQRDLVSQVLASYDSSLSRTADAQRMDYRRENYLFSCRWLIRGRLWLCWLLISSKRLNLSLGFRFYLNFGFWLYLNLRLWLWLYFYCWLRLCLRCCFRFGFGLGLGWRHRVDDELVHGRLHLIHALPRIHPHHGAAVPLLNVGNNLVALRIGNALQPLRQDFLCRAVLLLRHVLRHVHGDDAAGGPHLQPTAQPMLVRSMKPVHKAYFQTYYAGLSTLPRSLQKHNTSEVCEQQLYLGHALLRPAPLSCCPCLAEVITNIRLHTNLLRPSRMKVTAKAAGIIL